MRGPLTPDTYIFDHFSKYPQLLERPGIRETIFERLEGDLVAAMAAHHQSFTVPLRLLEDAVLPAAAASGDWRRFLRFAVVAVNLRGLAAELTPPVLAAVAAAGHGRLAAALAGERVDPLERLRARAAVAAALRRRDEDDQAVAADLGGSFAGDVEALPGPEARAGALAELAPQVADDLRGRWDGWIEELVAASPAAANRVRLALADVELGAGETGDVVWARLAAVSDHAALGELLARRARRIGDDLPSALARLRRLAAGDADLYTSAAVAVAAERAAAVPARAACDLTSAREGGPFAWSFAAIARGGAVWAALAPAERAGLHAELAAKPRLATALAVVALEAGGREELAEEAERVTAAPPADSPSPESLHWESRRLAADPRRDGSWRAGVGRLEALAARLRFALPPGDLARLLDLVAEAEPRRLPRRLDEALWAPESDAATLRGIAAAARHSRLLDELSRRTEQLAAAVAESEAAAFELRGELIQRLTIDACRRGESLEPLAAMAERLLPEEEDELRSELALALAADGRGRLAAAAAAAIAAPRLRRRAELAVLSVRADARALDPADLYHAVASIEPIEEELAALAALDDRDPDPRQVAARHLAPIADRGRRVLALAELARARLDDELRRPTHVADPDLALLPLIDGLGAAVSDSWLAALAPELAELGGRVSPGRALLELTDAAERVAGLTGAPWPERERAVLTILRIAPPLLAPRPGREGTRRQEEFLRVLLDLPVRVDDGPGGDDLRRHGHRLLAYLVAAAEAAREPVRRRLAAPSFAGLWRSLRGRRGGGSMVLERWRTPGTEVGVVADLCAAPAEQRRQREEEVLRGAGSPAEVEALAALAAPERPETALRLLAALLPDEERAARLRLATSGLLVPATAGASSLCLGGDPAALRARLRAGERLADDDLVALVAAGGLDADDPALLPLRLRLRDAAGPALAERLAWAVAPASVREGAPGGEAALRLWLHAAWRAFLGGGNGDSAALDGWRRAVRAAAWIGAGEPTREPEPSAAAPAARVAEGPAAPGGGVLAAWARVWSRRRGGHRTASEPRALFFLLGIAGAVLLPVIDAPDSDRPRVPFAFVVSLTVVAVALNALLLPSLLAREDATTPRAWARAGRRLFAAVPLVGLLVLPLWRWAAVALPRPLFADPAGGGAPGVLTAGGILRRPLALAATIHGVVALYLLNFLASVLLLTVMPLPSLMAGALHVLLFGGMLAALLPVAVGDGWPLPRGVAVLVAACWLLPIPGLPFLGILAIPLLGRTGRMALAAGSAERRGSVEAVRFWERSAAGERARWLASPLRRRLRGARIPPPAPALGESDLAMSAVAHLRLAGLFLETALVGGWMAVEAATLLAAVQGFTEIVAVLAALFLAGRFVAALAGSERPVDGFLAGTPWVAFCGLSWGAALGGGDAAEAAAVLVAASVAGATANVLPLLLGIVVQLPDESAGSSRLRLVRVLLCGFVGLGGLGEAGRGEPGIEPAMLSALLPVVPLLLLVTTGFLPRLAGRCGLRRGLGGPLSRHPGRNATGLLLWSALLPLGGLALPWWRGWRRRSLSGCG